MSKRPAKYADDGIAKELDRFLDEKVARIKNAVDKEELITRNELCKFVYGVGKSVYKIIDPHTKTHSNHSKRERAWTDAKGMLKEIINFAKFTPKAYSEECVCKVLEPKIYQILDRYRTFVATGEVKTKHVPPKLLGETEEILCVDKPCNYLCSYGGLSMQAPAISGSASASALLNGDKAEIQIHEYLCLKYDYETAVGTREWWKKNETELTCSCGRCGYCAMTQGGCCNRLDKETSGVMVAAKTVGGFKIVREQFSSEHSMEKGGTEKYYLALVHGTFKLPPDTLGRLSDHWDVKMAEDGRVRVDVTIRWNGRVSVPYDKGPKSTDSHKETFPGGTDDAQPALTLIEPVAWLKGVNKGETFTVVRVQIITGRRHQIRFHCAEVGYPLVGDVSYGAPDADREWCNRVFLHSYLTRFREPFTDRWFSCCSPLPQDLGDVLCKFTVEKTAESCKKDPIKSRREHKSLLEFCAQYDPSKPLLDSLDPPVVRPKVSDDWALKQGKKDLQATALVNGAMARADEANGSGPQFTPNPRVKRLRVTYIPPENLEKVPTTPQDPAVVAQQQALAQQQQALAQQQAVAQQQAQAAAPAAAAGGGWARRESRSAPGVFYYWNQATGETQAEPPLPWEKRTSRSNPNVFYYWNAFTGATSVEKPPM